MHNGCSNRTIAVLIIFYRQTYLNKHKALTQQLTNKEGSLASLLIQDLAEILVTGNPSHTDILKNKQNDT